MDSMPNYDMNNPEHVEMADEAAAYREQEERQHVGKLAQTYEGRAFVWMLMQQAGMGQSTFVGEAPMTMSYNEGRRSLGFWAENWLFTVAPATYTMMRREAVEREQRYAELTGLTEFDGGEDG